MVVRVIVPFSTPAVPAIPESVRLSVTAGPLNVGLLPPLTVRNPLLPLATVTRVYWLSLPLVESVMP